MSSNTYQSPLYQSPLNLITTPEFNVGELYPDRSEVDYSAQDFWAHHKAAMVRRLDDDSKYQRRVLNFGSSTKAVKAYEKKMKTKMKWHPAEKARAAQRVIRSLRINAGHGYKIQIVKDDSVDPPPMPPTPRKLSPLKNMINVLMQGAKDTAKKKLRIQKEMKEKDLEKEAKQIASTVKKAEASARKAAKKIESERKEKEKEKKNLARKKRIQTSATKQPLASTRDEDQILTVTHTPSESKDHYLEVKCCHGCGLRSCMNKKGVAIAVAAADTMKFEQFIQEMSGEERVKWFLDLYSDIDSSNVKYCHGLKCATRYANRQLNYETPFHRLHQDMLNREPELGLNSDLSVEAMSRDDESYCSSNYAKYLEGEEQYEKEVAEALNRKKVAEEATNKKHDGFAKTLTYPSPSI